jgi:hypothetical protein
MAPQVPHPERLEESEILPVNGHICRKGVEVEDRDVVAVVSKVREYIVPLISYSIMSSSTLPWLARVRRLIFLGGLDNTLELLRSFGPYERPGILVVAGDVVHKKFL